MAAPPLLPATGPPPFQFRPRRESPDWRRLSAVDVERLAAELDLAALQEHLGHVTFCSAERERCPHCGAPLDPLLLRLLRLAQLGLEYLLHSQDWLAAQLRLARARADRLDQDLARAAQQARALKEEGRRRKRALAALQQALAHAAGPAHPHPHQCQFCDKAFMNSSFLHSHLQRRHSAEPQFDQKQKEQTDRLQEEINKLKEQLQLTKSQLETEQHAHMAKLSKEYEEHRSKEEEILQLFHKWKEEEKEKLSSELEKVKEMFMKEFKELTAKNTELENHLLEVQTSNKHLKSNLGTLKDSFEFTEEKHQNAVDHENIMQLLERQETKWTSKVQTLQEAHETEKQQLTSQIEKLKTSMTEELNASNLFYKKRIEELGQRLQEQNDLIIAQKYQIQKLSTKKSVESIKLSDVKPSEENIIQPKQSLSSMRETEKSSPKVGKSKCHIIHSLKSNPSLTRELRAVLEQTLAEKLESLGIKSGVHGIPSDHLNRVLMSVESAREERKKQVPDIQHIREQLERQVSFRVAERASCSRFLSSPQLSPEVQQRAAHVRGSVSTTQPKAAKRSSIAKRPCVPRQIPAENTSTPKNKRSAVGDEIPKRLQSVTTPPFSSEEELKEDDIMQSYISPELSRRKAAKSNSKGSLLKFAGRDDISSSEEDEVEENKPDLQSSKNMPVQKGTDQAEKLPLSQGKVCKPLEGISVDPVPIQKGTQGVKFTGVEDDDEDEDDWDISSWEDEKPSPAKDRKMKDVPGLEKNESNSPSTPHAWGGLVGKPTKDEGLQDADQSMLKSSLVSVTDWSDSSDI
ncbi:cilium assembly protein DZIP1 isoform X2 [Anolis carolinensis]|uniref:cilium assembly protein DZIP1 isoform X2 n=1 Tax=Anolis carolinensis TaxID=28377 RepID=UPI002F2B2FE2